MVSASDVIPETLHDEANDGFKCQRMYRMTLR